MNAEDFLNASSAEDFLDQEGPQKEGFFDKVVGTGEALLGLGTGAFAGVYGPAVALSNRFQGNVSNEQADKLAGQVMEENTYQPRSEFGRDIMGGVGEFMNQVGIPAGAVMHTIPVPRSPRAPNVQTPPRNFDAAGVPEPVRPPIPTEAQPDLLPSNAPQYGINHADNSGHWSKDQNGMPIRTDLSIEAQQLQNPLQMNLWGDELGPAAGFERSLTDSITPENANTLKGAVEATPELTAAVDRLDPNLPQVELPRMADDNPVSAPRPRARSGQGGALDIEAISEGLSNLASKVKTAVARKPRPDTIAAPRSPETVALKQDLEKKASAVGYRNNEYERVQTIEDALSNPGPDIASIPGRDFVKSGLEGTIRTNTENRVLKFARDTFMVARNTAEKYSRDYVTGETGINKLYRALSKDEWMDTVDILKHFSEKQLALTDEVLSTVGVTGKQLEFIKKLREGLDEMYNIGNDALLTQGLEPFKRREGYLPSMFSGAYTTLLGHTDKNGKFVIKGVAQGDTKFQMQKAVEHYKSIGEEYSTTMELAARKLKETSVRSNNIFNGFNDLISVLARGDKDFNSIKAQADAYAAQQTHNLFDFKVHEKQKTGVKGSLGDRPWLPREENAKQMLEGIINYMEEGSRFYSYQTPLNNIKKLTSNPELGNTHRNTLQYLQRYSDNITGNNLNPIGGAMNWVLDNTIGTLAAAMESGGRSYQGSYKATSKVLSRARNTANAMMMGVFNLGFLATQLTQPVLGALPEMYNIRAKLGLSHIDVAKTMTDAIRFIPFLVGEKALGKKLIDIPQHWKDAYDHAVNSGMLAFSETELAHEVLMSKAESNMWDVAHWPSRYGELATRPPVFFTFVDLLKKAGYKGEDLMLRAQAATEDAMGNYHPDERPMLYSTFGAMGQFMGALTTYKHNLMGQFSARGKEAARGTPMPLAAMLGAGYLLYGVSGLPGYQEADEAVQRLTDASIKDHVGSIAKDNPDLWHGLASAKSGYDLQSRTSMASLVPDDVGGAISPQGSMLAGLLSKGIDAATLRDEASLKQLALASTPSGMKGMTEQGLTTDDKGFILDKSGQRKYVEPRTKVEQGVRALTGIRPLRERLEDEDLYARRQVLARNEKKLTDASKRLQLAWINGNMDDARKWIDKYQELGGNPEDILSSDQIAQVKVSAKQSSRQRLQGVPNDTLRSIRRYKAYADQP